MTQTLGKHIEILLVEDNPGDVRLTREALKEGKALNHLQTVGDGVEALEFLQQKGEHANAVRPDIILLDLNLPRKDGRELLADIKSDPNLRRIPAVILTTSKAEEDIIKTYDLHANCYITKPVDLDQFFAVIKNIKNCWMSVVMLPHRESR